MMDAVYLAIFYTCFSLIYQILCLPYQYIPLQISCSEFQRGFLLFLPDI